MKIWISLLFLIISLLFSHFQVDASTLLRDRHVKSHKIHQSSEIVMEENHHETMISMDEIILSKTTFSLSEISKNHHIFPLYRILPGDMLDVLFQIRTWIKKDNFKIAVDQTLTVKFVHSPELNQEQPVRPDGTISLPYLGEIYVVDKTVQQLTDELNQKYKGILSDPEIFIVVPKFNEGINELKKDLHTAPRGLSRLVTVRPDGYVTFPMVGDIFAVNRTITDVRDELNDRYEEMLPGLHVDLFLEQHSGSLIYIFGMVQTPGAHKIQKPISVIEALTLAGGYLPGAKLSNVFVIRQYEDQLVAKRINLAKTLKFNENSQIFILQPNDIIYIPKTLFKTATEVAQDIGQLAFFRGWNISISDDLNDFFNLD